MLKATIRIMLPFNRDEELEAGRPSVDERRAVYEKGYRIWQNIYLRAVKGAQAGLPSTCFQVQPVLFRQPYFPRNLDLKVSFGQLLASATSVWKGSDGHCDIDPLERSLQIPVSIDSPTLVSISADTSKSLWRLFRSGQNHFSVLVFAWSYILSARWAEIMPGATLQYTYSKAINSGVQGEGIDVVDIGSFDDEAARWWAAILAPRQGWEAYITVGEDKHRAPWSIFLPEYPKFSLAYHGSNCSLLETPVSAEAALCFLSSYCALHDVVDQGYAALSAVLFLPLLHDSRKELILPGLNPGNEQPLKARASECDMELDLAWMREDHNLDRLLTLSCNTRGIRSLLSSIFYESGVACNVVSPWLQSIFAVIDSVNDTGILAHILMGRVPHLALFWLGGVIMEIHKDVLQEGRFGLIRTELHAAAWSGTIQSFMQEPVLPATEDSVRRPDECRLLYLTQDQLHTSWPMCQWMPFGTTPLTDTDIDVRLHASCTGHGLQYTGLKWECQGGKVVRQMAPLAPTFPAPSTEPVLSDIVVDYNALDHKEESASENATRSIFGWLRVDGYPPAEKKIYEWIRIDDSEDEEGTNEDSGESHKSFQNTVRKWIDDNV